MMRNEIRGRGWLLSLTFTEKFPAVNMNLDAFRNEIETKCMFIDPPRIFRHASDTASVIMALIPPYYNNSSRLS